VDEGGKETKQIERRSVYILVRLTENLLSEKELVGSEKEVKKRKDRILSSPPETGKKEEEINNNGRRERKMQTTRTIIRPQKKKGTQRGQGKYIITYLTTALEKR